MKLLIILSLFIFSCQRSENSIPVSSDDRIERQEEYDQSDLREEEQIPVDSSDEMEYYRDVINEGELDN